MRMGVFKKPIQWLNFGPNFEAEVLSRVWTKVLSIFWSWCFVNILKLEFAMWLIYVWYAFVVWLLCACFAVTVLLPCRCNAVVLTKYFLVFSSAGQIFSSFSPLRAKYFPSTKTWEWSGAVICSNVLRGVDSPFPPVLKFLDDPSESAARQKKQNLKKNESNWNQKRKGTPFVRKWECQQRRNWGVGGRRQCYVSFSLCIVLNILTMLSWSIFTLRQLLPE